jgi:hypothetical protein
MNNLLTSHDDILSYLIKNTQNDAKNYFRKEILNKYKPLKKYNFKINYKPIKKRLTVVLNSVSYTDGNHSLKEDKSFVRKKQTPILVNWLGVERAKLEMSETVTIDINAESTLLPVFCKILNVNQGSTKLRELPIILRDVGLQVGKTKSNPITIENNLKDSYEHRSSLTPGEEYYSLPQYEYIDIAENKLSEIGAQVQEALLNQQVETNKLRDEKEKLLAHVSISTDDLNEYINVNEFSKTELLSPYSLEYKKIVIRYSKEYEEADDLAFKRYRKIVDKSRFDRLPKAKTLFSKNQENRNILNKSPPESLNSNYNDSLNENSIDLGKYEEYYVRNASVDTEDICRHLIKLNKLSHVQLLSETVSFEDDLRTSYLEQSEAPSNDLLKSILKNSNKSKFEINLEKSKPQSSREVSDLSNGGHKSASNIYLNENIKNLAHVKSNEESHINQIVKKTGSSNSNHNDAEIYIDTESSINLLYDMNKQEATSNVWNMNANKLSQDTLETVSKRKNSNKFTQTERSCDRTNSPNEQNLIKINDLINEQPKYIMDQQLTNNKLNKPTMNNSKLRDLVHSIDKKMARIANAANEILLGCDESKNSIQNGEQSAINSYKNKLYELIDLVDRELANLNKVKEANKSFEKDQTVINAQANRSFEALSPKVIKRNSINSHSVNSTIESIPSSDYYTNNGKFPLTYKAINKSTSSISDTVDIDRNSINYNTKSRFRSNDQIEKERSPKISLKSLIDSNKHDYSSSKQPQKRPFSLRAKSLTLNEFKEEKNSLNDKYINQDFVCNSCYKHKNNNGLDVKINSDVENINSIQNAKTTQIKNQNNNSVLIDETSFELDDQIYSHFEVEYTQKDICSEALASKENEEEKLYRNAKDNFKLNSEEDKRLIESPDMVRYLRRKYDKSLSMYAKPDLNIVKTKHDYLLSRSIK